MLIALIKQLTGVAGVQEAAVAVTLSPILISFGSGIIAEQWENRLYWRTLQLAMRRRVIAQGTAGLPDTLERRLRARDTQEASPARARPNARERSAMPIQWCRAS